MKAVSIIKKYNPQTLKVVTEGYQRGLDAKAVRTALANFKPELVRRPLCFKRNDGTVVVIDGQHTNEILRQHGETEAEYELLTINLTYEQRARLFTERNSSSKTVGQVEHFIASVEAKIPAAVDLAQVLAKHGAAISPSSGDIRAPSTLYDKNAQDLRFPLEAIDRAVEVAASWDGFKYQYNTHVLGGLCILFSEHPDADPARVRSQNPNPENVLANCGVNVSHKKNGCYKYMAERYNARLAEKNQLDINYRLK